MKIEVKGLELFSSVRDLQRIVTAADREQVTIEAYGDGLGKGRVTIRAGHLKDSAELSIAARVIETGAATVPFRALAQACLPYPHELLTVSDDALGFHIARPPESIALAATDANAQKMSAPPADAPRAVFDSGDVLAVMADVSHAMSNEPQYKPGLCGIKFELGADMKLRAIATDGRRLAVSARQVRRAELKRPEFDMFLPRAAIEFLARAKHGETVSFCKLNRSVAVETNGSYGVFGNDVIFPKWDQCVPHDPAYRATFNGGELADALSHAIEALELCDEVDEFGEKMETSFQVRIYSFNNGRAEITVFRADEAYAARFFSQVSCALPDGTEFKTYFNARYLLDAVRGKDGAVELYANTIGGKSKQLGTFVFHYPDAPHLFEVVMPLRMS